MIVFPAPVAYVRKCGFLYIVAVASGTVPIVAWIIRARITASVITSEKIVSSKIIARSCSEIITFSIGSEGRITPEIALCRSGPKISSGSEDRVPSVLGIEGLNFACIKIDKFYAVIFILIHSKEGHNLRKVREKGKLIS